MAHQSRVGELLVGKYRLDMLLGSGGVGDVYRAQNTLMGRTVAIKLLKPEHATDENVVMRFLREARAANLARHPNVVDVLDVGRDDDGIPFIVQEFLEGVDLGEQLKRAQGPLPPRMVLDLMIPVVQAVGLAHARGVVHRDLKPENVFLAQLGGKTVPKLLDFGISFVKPQPGDIRMTKTGMTVGTPAYMSPEQLEGTTGVDARTDVWALGVILYEALAGRLPFEGETSALMFAQIAWVDPLPLREVAPRVPAALEQVVSRCLQRKIANRYPTAAELARDLVHVREGRPIEPTHKRSIAPAPTAPAVHYEQEDVPREPPTSGPDIVPVAESIETATTSPNQSGIALATLRPPPAPVPEAPPEEGDSGIEGWTGIVAAVAMALLTAGVWMTVVHQAEGWPAERWLDAVLGGPGTPGALVLAVAAVLGAIALLTRFVRTQPRLWGLLPTAAGLVLFALPVGFAILNSSETSEPPDLWGWSMSLAFAGIAIVGGQRAWSSWHRGDTVGKLLGVALVSAATASIMVTVEVLRALLG
ncbi:MAG: serine/threonine-protein kinase [Myxococcota bacterium]